VWMDRERFESHGASLLGWKTSPATSPLWI